MPKLTASDIDGATSKSPIRIISSCNVLNNNVNHYKKH